MHAAELMIRWSLKVKSIREEAKRKLDKLKGTISAPPADPPADSSYSTPAASQAMQEKLQEKLLNAVVLMSQGLVERGVEVC